MGNVLFSFAEALSEVLLQMKCLPIIIQYVLVSFPFCGNMEEYMGADNMFMRGLVMTVEGRQRGQSLCPSSGGHRQELSRMSFEEAWKGGV